MKFRDILVLMICAVNVACGAAPNSDAEKNQKSTGLEQTKVTSRALEKLKIDAKNSETLSASIYTITRELNAQQQRQFAQDILDIHRGHTWPQFTYDSLFPTSYQEVLSGMGGGVINEMALQSAEYLDGKSFSEIAHQADQVRQSLYGEFLFELQQKRQQNSNGIARAENIIEVTKAKLTPYTDDRERLLNLRRELVSRNDINGTIVPNARGHTSVLLKGTYDFKNSTSSEIVALNIHIVIDYIDSESKPRTEAWQQYYKSLPHPLKPGETATNLTLEGTFTHDFVTVERVTSMTLDASPITSVGGERLLKLAPSTANEIKRLEDKIGSCRAFIGDASREISDIDVFSTEVKEIASQPREFRKVLPYRSRNAIAQSLCFR